MKNIFKLTLLIVIFSSGVIYASCSDVPNQNRFEGIEYKSNYIAKICKSAYPRLSNKNQQYNWELAVYKRCQSLFHRVYNGPSKPTYKEACQAAENQFNKHSSRWNVKIINRVDTAICSQSFTTGKNNEKEYSCSIWYSTNQETRVLKPLRSDIVLK